MTTNARDDSPQGIEFMESVMHPDLEWLARNVSEWPKTDGEPVSHIYRFFDVCEKPHVGRQFPEDSFNGNEYTRPQWQTARQQLGLDQPELTPVNKCLDNAWDEPTPEEEEAWQAKEREMSIEEARAILSNDNVNHPQHYQSDNGIECIDAIRAALGLDGFVAHCRGTAIKYAFRAGKKQAHAEDLRKAAWYLTRAAEALEE